jgi:hypothetical protein
MATRSNIGIVNLDKSITGIYCHWDGYPEYVGKMLLNHYNNDDIVNGLMNLGDLSILSENMNPTGPHYFNNPQDGVCVAYGRDRGETGPTNSRTFEDLGEYENSASNTWADYQYLFDNGKWSYRNTYGKGGWNELTAEVCK